MTEFEVRFCREGYDPTEWEDCSEDLFNSALEGAIDDIDDQTDVLSDMAQGEAFKTGRREFRLKSV